MKLNKIYTLILGAALLSSCKSEEPVEPVAGTTDVPVEITIMLATESSSRSDEVTRSESEPPAASIWEEGENGENRGGNEFENRINTVTPVLYAVNGTTIDLTSGPVGTMKYTMKKEQDKNDPGKWIISGTMSTKRTATELKNGKYRLALFINSTSSDIKNPVNVNNPATASFYHHNLPDQSGTAEDTNNNLELLSFSGIPMYGVMDVKFVDYLGGVKIQMMDGSETISIPVLRSMAKVRVALHPDLDGRVVLKSLMISRHALQGKVVPKLWNTSSSLVISGNGKYMNAITGDINEGYNHNCYVYKPLTDPDEDHQWKNSSKKLRFYLPDTYNWQNDGKHDEDGTPSDGHSHDDVDSPEIYMEITYQLLESGQEFTHKMYFRPWGTWNKPWADQKPWDIIRNHIYEFVIDDVEPTTGDMNVKVSIVPWEKHDMPTEWYGE